MFAVVNTTETNDVILGKVMHYSLTLEEADAIMNGLPEIVGGDYPYAIVAIDNKRHCLSTSGEYICFKE